jgi:hypothetical protein
MKNAAVVVLFLVSAVLSQTVNITGTVTSGGTPVQGAVVKLFVQALACTSKADGSYSLGGQVPTIRDKMSEGSQHIFFKNNSFVFDLAGPANADARLFDLSGRLAATVFKGRLSQGQTRVPFSMGKFGQKLYLLRLTLGGVQATYPMVWRAEKEFSLSATPLTLSNLQKPAAGPAAVDWLQGSKAGYAASVQQISSYTGVINITLGALTAPNWGANVKIFDPTMSASTIQSGMSFSTGEFNTNRVAWFFKPGSYSLTITTNYYIQAYGLGVSPESTQVTGAVQNTDGGLTAFWRGVEGFSVNGNDTWAVSQADPFRRMHVKGNLNLCNSGGSGGFLSDCKIDGQIATGCQQQFYFRNLTLGTVNAGGWSFLFQGCDNPPTVNWPSGSISVVAKTPLVREKPYVIFEGGSYAVFVPAFRTTSQGTGWYNQTPLGERIPIDQFYIAQSSTDNVSTINAALAQGKNLILTPGIYSVTTPILVQRPNTVVLGLGMATIKPQNGVVGLKTADAPGIIIANILFDAGTTQSPCMLQVGDSGSTSNNSTNPTIVSDIFGRVGGGGNAQAKVHVILNSNYSILDHCWLWRADHGSGAGWTTNPCNNGLVVNGNNCITYGQMVEHNQQHNTIWNGNNGQMYFYQNELPYDVSSQANFKDGTKNGWSALYVTAGVTKFAGYSLGIYSYFNQTYIEESNAIETPRVAGIEVHHVVTFSLGNDQGQITHVINDTGATAKWTATSMVRFGDYVGH